MKEYTVERQLDLFDAESFASRNLANRGGEDLNNVDFEEWVVVERRCLVQVPKIVHVIKKLGKRLFDSAKQMSFNFNLKFIIDMKRASKEAKRMMKDDFSLIGISYQNALSVVFKLYQKWKIESVFSLDRIPSYVFIQE